MADQPPLACRRSITGQHVAQSRMAPPPGGRSRHRIDCCAYETPHPVHPGLPLDHEPVCTPWSATHDRDLNRSRRSSSLGAMSAQTDDRIGAVSITKCGPDPTFQEISRPVLRCAARSQAPASSSVRAELVAFGVGHHDEAGAHRGSRLVAAYPRPRRGKDTRHRGSRPLRLAKRVDADTAEVGGPPPAQGLRRAGVGAARQGAVESRPALGWVKYKVPLGSPVMVQPSR